MEKFFAFRDGDAQNVVEEEEKDENECVGVFDYKQITIKLETNVVVPVERSEEIKKDAQNPKNAY